MIEQGENISVILNDDSFLCVLKQVKWIKDLCNCSKVSKKWKIFAETDSLWHDISIKTFDQELLKKEKKLEPGKKITSFAFKNLIFL